MNDYFILHKLIIVQNDSDPFLSNQYQLLPK